MATIGLDKLYYAKITEDENGNETYASPVQMAKAMTADLSVELAEATLYADDGASTCLLHLSRHCRKSSQPLWRQFRRLSVLW